jgi:molybdopterin biosynthesis enzyme
LTKEIQMLLRKIMLAAFVLTPLAASPAKASAQDNGLERAASASAQADAVVGVAKSSAAKRPTRLPPGIAKVFTGETLPPGTNRAFPQPDQDEGGDVGEGGDVDEGGEGDEGGEVDAGVCMGGFLWVGGIPTGDTCQ